MSESTVATASVPKATALIERALYGPATSPIVSIHDVMPETMSPVAAILERLDRRGAPKPILLVVPGRAWKTTELAQLRAWADSGIPLAGHGWHHQTSPAVTLYHRLHSALLSRNVAEHLALDTSGVLALLDRNYTWFDEQFLPGPELYVPPAWAMGAVSRAELARLPFRFYETLTGIYDAHDDSFHRIPLVGYEADTPLRTAALKVFNVANYALARAWSRPLRIAIHPYDFDYRLREDLAWMLDNGHPAR